MTDIWLCILCCKLRSELKASDDDATRTPVALTLSSALLSFVVLDGVLVDVEPMLKLHFLVGGELKFIIRQGLLTI